MHKEKNCAVYSPKSPLTIAGMPTKARRKFNCTAQTLRFSECVVKCQMPAEVVSCARLRSILPSESVVRSSKTGWLITVPHEKIDAFALLNAVEDSRITSNLNNSKIYSGTRCGVHRGLEWKTEWRRKEENGMGKSFLRRFMEKIAGLMRPQDIIAVPVLLDWDDCRENRFYSGVGFGSALMSCKRVTQMSQADKDEWRAFLRERALLSVRKIEAGESQLLLPAIVVSSLGNLAIQWPMLKADPAHFTIFSTPVHPDVPHVILWHSNQQRNITVCRTQHCTFDTDFFFHVWRKTSK